MRRLYIGFAVVNCEQTKDRWGVKLENVKIFKNLGMLFLGIWLIATGLIPLLHISFSGQGTGMAVLAIAAGILLLIGR